MTSTTHGGDVHHRGSGKPPENGVHGGDVHHRKAKKSTSTVVDVTTQILLPRGCAFDVGCLAAALSVAEQADERTNIAAWWLLANGVGKEVEVVADDDCSPAPKLEAAA
ncbi:MAG: hypothetical protein QM661_09695 [Solimonas sp.]